jgi:subtilase family serine protease
LSYTVAQIRSAYGINSIPNFGTATADGTGQTIAIIEDYNDPTVLTDLDAFDQAMSLTTTSTQTLYQKYGAAATFVKVYNENGDDITKNIANSGADGVPTLDPSGSPPTEEALDVEWAHAIAPDAPIDVIECNSASFKDHFAGIAAAANLSGVSAISISWGGLEISGDASTYDPILTARPDHTGITILASTGDEGNPGSEYPAFSPYVVAVGGTDLSLNNNAYESETAWSFPTPKSTLNNGSTSYSQTGSWAAQSGGFSGTYSTAAAGSNSSATWTSSISSSDQDGSGVTEVSATWTANATNATNAEYQIYDGTASTGTLLGTMTVDQTKAPVGISDGNTQFQSLGIYQITSGTLTVVLSANSANGSVTADAIGIAPALATGGGVSLYEPQPSYQNGVLAQSTTNRATPDVAFEALGNSGVTIYQTDQKGNSGFSFYHGGTSLSCPCWAGLIAIADQGRAALGEPDLDSAASSGSTLQALYSLPTGDFHDITSGYNGLTAGTGYDFLTGLGSPIADHLVPDLVKYGILTVTTNPSDQTVTEGDSVTFTASVSGSPTATAQWQVSKDSGKSWSNIANPVTANSVTLTLSNITADMNGYEYEAVFSNGIGMPATTTAATLTVQSAPKVTANPSDQTVTAGQPVTFTAAADGNPTPTVQWKYSSNGGATWSNVSGGASTTLILSNVPTAWNGYEYEAVFSNGVGTPATTTAAILTVNPLPSPPSPPASPPVPPSLPSPPALDVPPLLAFFDSLLGGGETVNADGTATITDNFFGIPLLLATFDHSGHLVSVTLFGMNVTFLFA